MDCDVQTSPEGSMMSAMTNGFHEEEEMLTFQNAAHGSDILTSLCSLRKNQKFCDVKLVVENHEIFAHRAVLAAQSATMFDILSKDEDANMPTAMIKLKDVNFKGFSYLIDYMYTGRLAVPPEEVCGVYKTARRLRLPIAAQACADFLCSALTPANCLDVRVSAEDDHFRSKVNEYIQSNLNTITQSKHFFGLPRLQLEVVGADESLLTSTSVERLCDLALDWVKTSVDEVKPKLDRLIEKVNVLYLSADNVLRDCRDIEEENIKEDMRVQDYKKLIRKQTGTVESRGDVTPPTPSSKSQLTFHKFNIEPELRHYHREWSVVASYKTQENTYLSLMMLDSQMATLSLHFRIPQVSPYNSGSEGPDSPINSKANSYEHLTSLIPLGTLSMPRCAFGIRAVQGKIIACGGYDRGEIMKSAEMYDPELNTWVSLPDMIQARCRFTAAHLDGKLYAIGGSDGHNELSSVECFDPLTQKWTRVASLNQARASPGVAVLKGKIYCVGGSNGQKSLRKCEVYDPQTDTWSPTASLNTGRFQACVRAFKTKLYAVGGTDGFNVFSTVEVFSPETNSWELGPSLNVARRGAGIEAFNSKLYIVGGSDGTQSLKTTESFDPKEQIWTFTSALGTPRANVGAAVIDNKLFAVGGYSGKRFLDTMEYFDVDLNEWRSFDPFTRSRSHSLSSGSDVDSNSAGKNAKNGVNNEDSVNGH